MALPMSLSFGTTLVCLLTILYARNAQAIVAKDSLEPDVSVEVKRGEQPWLALLELPGGAFCSGTIVSPTSVLSAASCLQGLAKPLHGTVYAGNVKYREPKDFEPPTQNRSVVAYHLYDENNTLLHNLMLVKIDREWVWSAAVQPISITEDERVSEKFASPCYVTGLGGRSSSGDSKVARAATVWLGKCEHSPQVQHICSQEAGALVPLAGDLGGPVLCEYVPNDKLYGIISEYGKSRPELPADANGFQFVGFYAPWIKKTAGDMLSAEVVENIRQQYEHFPNILAVSGPFKRGKRDAGGDGSTTAAAAAGGGGESRGLSVRAAPLVVLLAAGAGRSLC